MNVIGSRPDGSWRDRPGARRRLTLWLAPLAAAGIDVTVVFDGRATPGEVDDATAHGITALFAPGGPNAADDAIVELVRGLLDPSDVTVVTSDAALAARVRSGGASVQGVQWLRRRLEGEG